MNKTVASAMPAFTRPVAPGSRTIYSRDGSKVITSKRSGPQIPPEEEGDIEYVAGDNIDFEYDHPPSVSQKKKKKKKKKKHSSDGHNSPPHDSVRIHQDGNGITINNIDFTSRQSIASVATAAAQAVVYNDKSSSSSKKKYKKKEDKIWDTSTEEERQRINEFWLSLSEEERRNLVRLEKDTVLQKMKEQQRHSCSCAVCGRKRLAIEEELEALYDSYYEELEDHSAQKVTLGTTETDQSSVSRPNQSFDLFGFSNSLAVQGGILTVADDLLKNDGKKFIDMMEQLAERRMAREEETLAAVAEYDDEYDDDDLDDLDDDEEDGEEDDDDDEDDDEFHDDDDDEDYEDDEDDEDGIPVSEDQRMAEGRQMLQIFAARMFEQRVLSAYRERVAQDRQKKLLEELEEESRLEEERELKKQREKEKKKDKKLKQRQAKEEEKARKEAERLQAEAALKAERQKKMEAARQKQLELKQKKEAERRAHEEEKRRRLEEERKREQEKERKRKEREEQEAKKRMEKEQKEQEALKAKRAEEAARHEAERQKELEAERARKEQELRHQQEKEAAALAKQQHQKELLASLTQNRLDEFHSTTPLQKASELSSPASSLSTPSSVNGLLPNVVQVPVPGLVPNGVASLPNGVPVVANSMAPGSQVAPPHPPPPAGPGPGLSPMLQQLHPAQMGQEIAGPPPLLNQQVASPWSLPKSQFYHPASPLPSRVSLVEQTVPLDMNQIIANPMPIQRPPRDESLFMTHDDPVDEISRVMGSKSLIADEDDFVQRPTPVTSNGSGFTSSLTANNEPLGRSQPLFGGSSLFSSNAQPKSPQIGFGSGLWSNNASLPSRAASSPWSEKIHAQSSRESVKRAAISTYRALSSEGWAADGFVPAQVLFHATGKVLGGIALNQNDFYNACGVFDQTQPDRFEVLRDSVGLITHLKYKGGRNDSLDGMRMGFGQSNENSHTWPMGLAGAL